MKKFTLLENSSIKNNQESTDFRSEILSLMDYYLKVRSNGSSRQELHNDSLSIDGKDHFVNLLIELINKNNYVSLVSTLESMKKNIGDWAQIDNKIESILKESRKTDFLLKNKKGVKRIKNFIKLYESSLDFENDVERFCNKIINKDDLKILESLSNIMVERGMIEKDNIHKMSLFSEKLRKNYNT